MTCGDRLAIPLRVVALIALGTVIGLADSAFRPVQVRLAPGAAADTEQTRGQQQADAPERRGAETGEPPAAVDEPRPSRTLPEGHIGIERAVELFDEGLAQFLDARHRDEFLESRIMGAHHVPLEAFRRGRTPEVLEFFAFDTPLVVYCGGGDCEASEDVAIRLQQSGFQRIYILHDGFPAWLDAGLPVEDGEPAMEGGW